MNPETVVILIAGGTGAIIGAIIGATVTAALSCRAAIRAEKNAWRVANIYYSRKETEP